MCAGQPRLYLIRFLALGFLLALAGALVNLAVDPFNRLGRNSTGVYAGSERDSKRALVMNVPHEALLMGSSMVAYIDPAPLPCHRFVNAAFASALPEEMLDFLKHQPPGLRAVLLGLDPYMMNEASYPLASMRRDDADRLAALLDDAAYVFSLGVLNSSLRTLAADWVRAQQLEPLGNRNAARMLERNDRMPAPDYEGAIRTLIETDYRGFRYSKARLAALAELNALAQARGIRLFVFLNPLNEDLRDALARLGMEETLARFRRDMTALFPGLADFTDSPYAARDGYFRFDPYHYLPSTGERMALEVLSLPDAACPDK